MFTLSLISKMISGLRVQPYLPQIRKVLPEEQQNENYHVVSDGMISSGWQFLKFEKREGYWKSYIAAPEISKYILNHAEVLIYYRRGDIVSKLNHYTDEGFWKNLLWTDHCVLLQKVLLISNYDASASYRYIIIPEGVKDGFSLLPPDHKNYQAVCRYYNIQ